MRVIIESTVGGNVAGYLQCTVSGDESISSLILNYCESKGIPVNPNFVLRDQKGATLDGRKTIADCGVRNGSTLFLELRGTQGGVFRFINWWYLALGAILVSIGGIAVVIVLHILTGPTPTQFGIVLDGGSSHTALYIYEWPGPKWKGTGVLKQLGTCDMKGDITSFSKNVSGVDAFLSPCLSYASSQIPSASHFSTPIYFGGTAGLRLLNISEPSATSVLLDSIRNRLSRSGFSFDSSYVEILSGTDEAQFGWVTVNSQLKYVGPDETLATLNNGSQETVGALDLGGASTQISMEVPKRHKSGSINPTNGVARENEVKNLNLYSSSYSVYSHSSLCYGVSEVVKRYESMLIVDTETTPLEVLNSPCQPLGYTTEVKADNIFSSPCSQNRTNNVQQWTIKGTSNYADCFSLIERLFDTEYCQSHFLPQTCFSNSDQPPVEQENFVAFSSFQTLAKELNITNGSSLESFRHAVQSVCNMTWNEITNSPFQIPNSSFTPLLCLEGQYVLSLLTSGYGFDEKSWKNLHFVKQISDADVGWAMGYMTEKTNAIAASNASIFLATAPFVALVVLFSLFMVIGFLLSYHAIKMRRSSNSYSRKLLLKIDDELERFLPAFDSHDQETA